MTAPDDPQQPQQPPQLPPTIPPPEADESVLVPILLAVLAAYLTYRTAKGAIKGSWQAVAKLLGLPELAGGALDAVARRALDRQRKASGRTGDELWEYNEAAAKEGVNVGVHLLVDILKGTPEPERSGGTERDSAGTKRDTGPTVPQGPDPVAIREMAAELVQAVGNGAQTEAAIQAGWLKRWKSVHDLRVRYSHAFLDGVQVSASEPFITEDGVEIMFPHDPAAPVSETINCRCSVTYRRPAVR
jgi:hypothetical protein